MQKYRALVHYYFNKGMVKEGIRFLERELIKKAEEYGCHDVEIWQSEKDINYVVGMGTWNSLEDARRFQALWESKEQELTRLCINTPKREFFKIQSMYRESKKAA